MHAYSSSPSFGLMVTIRPVSRSLGSAKHEYFRPAMWALRGPTADILPLYSLAMLPPATPTILTSMDRMQVGWSLIVT